MARKTSKSSLTPVDPLPGLAPWIGGKTLLARELGERIDAIPHTCYAEPFVGMGAAFFGRNKRPKVEVINDLNDDVVTAFRAIRDDARGVLRELRFRPFSRSEFTRQVAIDPRTLNDAQRAARFIYIQRTRFGGNMRGSTFATTATSRKAIDTFALRRRLMAASRRLSFVNIEQLPYAEFIRRYDRPGTLFYLDPPYWGCETYYGVDIFSRDDFAELAHICKHLKGRFVMSINDVPEIRKLFRFAKIERVAHQYSCSQKGRLPVHELIISG